MVFFTRFFRVSTPLSSKANPKMIFFITSWIQTICIVGERIHHAARPLLPPATFTLVHFFTVIMQLNCPCMNIIELYYEQLILPVYVFSTSHTGYDLLGWRCHHKNGKQSLNGPQMHWTQISEMSNNAANESTIVIKAQKANHFIKFQHVPQKYKKMAVFACE